MSTIYGPVPSWRFGRSLGIDVITPPKTCTYNCIYCQLGKTKLYVKSPEMVDKPLVNKDRIIRDLRGVLERIDLGSVDIVTFSGCGEPTLNMELREIARCVKEEIGEVPMAILSNASLLHREDIRRNLERFDVIVAKMDAGDDETFRRINRPADEKLSVEIIADSIKKLKGEVGGAVCLEVMLLESVDGEVCNVRGESLSKLINSIIDVDPDIVQLEVPYRPPSESYVKAPTEEDIQRVFDELSEGFKKERIWVYGKHDMRGRKVYWRKHKRIEDEIYELLKRRPCSVADISASMGIDPELVMEAVSKLEEKGLIASKIEGGERYYFEISR